MRRIWHGSATYIYTTGRLYNETSICRKRLQTICSSNNNLVPQAICSTVLLLHTPPASLCFPPLSLSTFLSHTGLVPLFSPISYADRLSPHGLWVFRNEIPGGERSSVRESRGEEKTWGADRPPDPLALWKKKKLSGTVQPSLALLSVSLVPSSPPPLSLSSSAIYHYCPLTRSEAL